MGQQKREKGAKKALQIWISLQDNPHREYGRICLAPVMFGSFKENAILLV